MATISTFTLSAGDKLVLSGQGGVNLTLPSTMKATIIPKGAAAAKASTTAAATGSTGLFSSLGLSGLFSLKGGVIASATAAATASPLVPFTIAAATGVAVWKAMELKKQEAAKKPQKHRWL